MTRTGVDGHSALPSLAECRMVSKILSKVKRLWGLSCVAVVIELGATACLHSSAPHKSDPVAGIDGDPPPLTAYTEAIDPKVLERFPHLRGSEGHWLLGNRYIQVVVAGAAPTSYLTADLWQPIILGVYAWSAPAGRWVNVGGEAALDLRLPGAGRERYISGLDARQGADARVARIDFVVAQGPKGRGTLAGVHVQVSAGAPVVMLSVEDFVPAGGRPPLPSRERTVDLRVMHRGSAGSIVPLADGSSGVWVGGDGVLRGSAGLGVLAHQPGQRWVHPYELIWVTQDGVRGRRTRAFTLHAGQSGVADAWSRGSQECLGGGSTASLPSATAMDLDLSSVSECMGSWVSRDRQHPAESASHDQDPPQPLERDPWTVTEPISGVAVRVEAQDLSPEDFVEGLKTIDGTGRAYLAEVAQWIRARTKGRSVLTLQCPPLGQRTLQRVLPWIQDIRPDRFEVLGCWRGSSLDGVLDSLGAFLSIPPSPAWRTGLKEVVSVAKMEVERKGVDQLRVWVELVGREFASSKGHEEIQGLEWVLRSDLGILKAGAIPAEVDLVANREGRWADEIMLDLDRRNVAGAMSPSWVRFEVRAVLRSLSPFVYPVSEVLGSSAYVHLAREKDGKN